MHKNKFVLLMTCLAITSMILALPIQLNTPIQLNITISNQPEVKAKSNGFFFGNWTLETIYVDPALGALWGYNIGDKTNISITRITTSALTGYTQNPTTWYAQAVWCTFTTFNVTEGFWTISPELLLAAYNSTYPYINDWDLEPGQYYSLFGLFPELIPLNFTTANHTIVNYTYDEIANPIYPFYHTDPSSIVGTWIMWEADEFIIGAKKWELTYNEYGIRTRMRNYQATGSSWQLMYDVQLVEMAETPKEEVSTELLLLALMAGSGGEGDLMSSIPMMGIFIGVGLGVGLFIGLLIGRRE